MINNELESDVEEIVKEFDAIFNAIPGKHMILKVDPPKFTILAANKSHLELVNRSKEGLIGRGIFEVFPPGPDNLTAADELTSSFCEVIEHKKVHYLPAQRYDLSGENLQNYSEKFWRIKNSPVFGKNGNVKLIINSIEDVTEDVLLKRREKEIGSIMQSHNLFLQVPISIQIYRAPDLKLQLANEPTLKRWGKGTEVIGKTLFEILPELKNDGYEEVMLEVVENEITKSFYERPVSLMQNGELITLWFNITFQPYYENNSEKPVGVLVFADEVTDRVISRKLVEANKMLEEKNKELERFAFIASHDLQEPLRKVSFFVRLLEENLIDIDSQSRMYLGKINKATQRMADLIRDILDFSRLTVNKEDYSHVNLNYLILDILTDFEILIQQTGAEIKFDNLPTIQANSLQMQQLFHNLISNALKFRKKDITPLITITCERKSYRRIKDHDDLLPKRDYYIIRVTDNGIGFKSEHSERIFGIFQRLHTQVEYDGTGIGLALCRKIVENHHGRIKATSNHDNGAVFEVMLPA